MASHTSRIDEQVKFNSDRANVVIQKKKQDDERKRKQMYDDALVNPTNATSAPSLLSGAPAGLDSSDQSQGPQLPPEVAQHVTGPDATPQTQAAFTTGVQTGAKAVLTAQADRAQSQAPAAGNGVTAPLIPSQSQLAAPVQNLFSGFGGKSPFARMLSGALQAAGGSPTGFPSQPAAAAQAPQAAQPPQAAQAQTAAQPVQTAQQTPQTAAQANPFPEQQSQAAQDARDQSVQQSAQTMATDPAAAQLAQRSAERQQMLSQYQQQLADLKDPKSPLTTLQKVQQAQGIRAKIAAIGADILGQVKVDPNAMGAFAMARGTGIGAGAKAYQETAQADQRNDLEQQQLTQQQIQQKAQLLQDNMKAWQTMMDRDDSDQDANNKRYAQENTDAQEALEHGAKDYGTFTGDVQGALAKAIQSGQINPSNVHVYHVGDGQVRVVEALDHTVDADTANKTLAANGVDYKVPDGQSISKRSLYTRVQNEQNQQAQLHQELTKAQQESDIVQKREVAVAQVKADAEAKAKQAAANADAVGADAFGVAPTLPPGKEYDKRNDSFKKNLDALTAGDGVHSQFNGIVNDAMSGKLNGPESMVGLLDGIGISSTNLKGQGFRITKDVINQHENATGWDQLFYRQFLGMKDGDVVTPKQIQAYANVATNQWQQQHINLYNQMQQQGLNADAALPHPEGIGAKIDPSTMQIFFRIAGGNSNDKNDKRNPSAYQKATQAAQKAGWALQ